MDDPSPVIVIAPIKKGEEPSQGNESFLLAYNISDESGLN